MASSRRIPVLGLVDYDPDGIGILSTYKYGSVALTHENHALTVPNIRWIGLRSCDILRACNSPLTQDTRQNQGLINLSARDRRRAIKMLGWEHIGEGGFDADWRRELQVMLMLNLKAEIQLLDEMEGGAHRWVLGKLAAL